MILTNVKTEMMVLIINNLHVVLYVREICDSYINARIRSGDQRGENVQLNGEFRRTDLANTFFTRCYDNLIKNDEIEDGSGGDKKCRRDEKRYTTVLSGKMKE
jgi:hypothetical protein